MGLPLMQPPLAEFPLSTQVTPLSLQGLPHEPRFVPVVTVTTEPSEHLMLVVAWANAALRPPMAMRTARARPDTHVRMVTSRFTTNDTVLLRLVGVDVAAPTTSD